MLAPHNQLSIINEINRSNAKGERSHNNVKNLGGEHEEEEAGPYKNGCRAVHEAVHDCKVCSGGHRVEGESDAQEGR